MAMTVYEMRYQVSGSAKKHRMWFTSRLDAEVWKARVDAETSCHNFVGPRVHVLPSDQKLVDLLCRLGSEGLWT